LTAWRVKRKVMGRYDVTAASYNEQYGEEQQRKYVKALENVHVGGKKFLDVGCGTGLFFDEVTEKAEISIGVDLSRKLLQKAKSHVYPFQNTHILQADADHLPFKDDYFGAIFAFTILQNMPKPPETLRELKRVAGSGGRIVVTGLKRAFPLEKFMDILEGSGMKIAAFVDDEAVNCYIAVLEL
jgi:ubiquinone/menaquinone biosynthesis C-methylase UbiE